MATEPREPNLFHYWLIYFIISLCLTTPIAWYYYNGDIAKHQRALRGDEYLIPLTDQEYKQWEIGFKQADIKQSQAELNYMRRNMPVPEHVENITTNYIMNTPLGHNPPRHVIQAKIQELYGKRTALLCGAAILSALIGLYFGQRDKVKAEEKKAYFKSNQVSP